MMRCPCMRVATLMLATCMVLAMAPPALAAEPVDSMGLDPAAAWERFLGDAVLPKVLGAYSALDSIGYNAQGVDPEACKAHRAALDAAVNQAPISIALHHAAMLCAEAMNDQAAAEKEMAVLAAYSRFALSQASESHDSRPIRLLHLVDAYALLRIAGLELRYEYYQKLSADRYFPVTIVGWDADANVERHLTFDFVDVMSRINREDTYSGFPVDRQLLAEAFVSGQVEARGLLGLDVKSVNDASRIADARQKVGILKPVAALGGILATRAWIAVCTLLPYDGCGDGLADAIMPYAEKKQALSMTLLAYTYAEGIGVDKDPAAATTLLDAANRRWPKQSGSVEFANIWMAIHEGQVPDAIGKMLSDADAAGNPNARMLVIRRKLLVKEVPELDAGELEYLARPSSNELGAGEQELAFYYAMRKDEVQENSWDRRAALHGDADAQAEYGYSLLWGDEKDRDEAEGERMLAEAAHGGSAYAQRNMAYLSRREGKWKDAEGWLLGSARRGDAKSILDLANLYEWQRPGLEGKVGVAVDTYRALAREEDSPQAAQARRRLAAMALAGRGMGKAPGKAKEWLLVDAEKGDHESEGMLGMAYLNGDFGAVGEAEGRRWMERAMAAGEADAFSEYGYWLYYKKKSPDARISAIELWQKGDKAGSATASNNLAWAWCTSEDAAIVDPVRGAEVAARIAKRNDLDAGEIDTVAACRAGVGDFADAARLQQTAIDKEMENNPGKGAPGVEPDPDSDEAGYRRRLALYQAKQPYVEKSKD